MLCCACVGWWMKVRWGGAVRAWVGGEWCAEVGEGGGGEWYVAHRKSLIMHLRIVRIFATDGTNL